MKLTKGQFTHWLQKQQFPVMTIMEYVEFSNGLKELFLKGDKDILHTIDQWYKGRKN